MDTTSQIENILNNHRSAAATEISRLLGGGLNGVNVQPAANATSTPVVAAAPPKATAAKKTAKKTSASTEAKPDKAGGEKRDPAVLAALVETVYQHIKKNPGQNMEAIRKALGNATTELMLPIRKLKKDGRLTTTGEKRATVYTAV